MKLWKKVGGLALSGALILSLAGCSIPKPGFADYDVSGYVKALLDSSYHDENGELVKISGISETDARANNATTVENAAVRFCNLYAIAPGESQLQDLQAVMKQAFALARYTVKDERKVDGGYYLEVEVASITNFQDRQEDILKLKDEAEAEALAQSRPAPTPTPEPQEDGDEEEDGGEPETTPIPDAVTVRQVDANALFVDKVLDFCKRELANISYDGDTRTIALDVRQTDEGELQLNMDQIAVIDQTVVRFSK